jgi:small-conductance mechanosensitive channel/CRP-like cAMP-binding protein
MESLLKALGSASSQTIGLSIALALLAANWLLVPSNERRLLRQPFIYLGVHLASRIVELFFRADSALGHLVGLLSLGALLATIGRSAVLLVFEVVLHRRLSTPVPKIIRDIVQGVVYFLVLLAILRQVGFEPGQILTTSALLTAVIGLSLQETLGNLVAGLAVQLQRPFDVGDWIQFDGELRHVGRVIEINWRATKLVTLDELEIVVPNGLLAKAPLKNYTKPTPAVRRSLYVQIAYDVPPKRVQEIVLEAVKGAPDVLEHPAPSVVTNDFKESGVEYWIRFFLSEFHRRDGIDGGVRDRVWYALRRAGITPVAPQRQLHMHHVSEESRAADRERRTATKERALEKVDFLTVIDGDQRRELAERASTRLFSPGEVIVRQGDETAELFIILKGEVSIVLENEKTTSSTEVARLVEGQFFGEMALVTGERRKATVKAGRECELLVIDKLAFQDVLRKNPTVIEQLSEILAERQLKLDATQAELSSGERASVKLETSSQLIGKIKKFFAINR